MLKRKILVQRALHLYCSLLAKTCGLLRPSEFENHGARDDDSQGDEHAAGAATTIPDGRRRVRVVRSRGSRPSRRVAGRPGSSATDPLVTPSAAASPDSVPARRVRLCRRAQLAARALAIEGPTVSHPRGYTPRGKDIRSLTHSFVRVFALLSMLLCLGGLHCGIHVYTVGRRWCLRSVG